MNILEKVQIGLDLATAISIVGATVFCIQILNRK